jgi:Mycobacterium membrane protein
MPRMEGAVRRRWIPIVVAVACLVGGAAVYRLHGLFGAGNAALVGGARSEKIIEINPKNVTYQLFGPSNTSGTVSFLDADSQPQTANFGALPWQITVTTTLSSMVANIVAQGNSDSLGCRIIVNGDVRDEHASTELNAATYCLVKSA